MDDNKLWIPLSVLGAIIIGSGVFYYYFYKPSMSAAPAPASTASVPAAPATPVGPLNLDQADALLAQRAGELSSLPDFAKWFKTENIIRRLTAAVNIISNGDSPRDSLDFLGPDKKFSARKKGAKYFIDQKSYARYDGIANAVASLNVDAAGRLYQDLKPTFESACQEQDCAKNGFQATLVRAISELLRTPVVTGNIQLRRKVTSYSMVDFHLEGLSAAQKHLLRMGPDNMVRIQAKLRELAHAIGAGDDQLPQPQTYSTTGK